MIRFIIIHFSITVLIETYWNVKMHCPHGMRNVSSINRNILECKVLRLRQSRRKIVVLIETYWNVKKSEEIVTSSPFWY